MGMFGFDVGSSADRQTSTNTTLTSTNIDRRLALGENAVGIGGDRNTIDTSQRTTIDWQNTDNSVMTTSDHGAITGALDAITTSNVMQGATLEKLIMSSNKSAADLVTGGRELYTSAIDGSNAATRQLLSANQSSLTTLTSMAGNLIESVMGSSKEQQRNTLTATENALDAVGSAYSKSMVDSKGSLEQKTIVILAIAAAAAFAFWTRRGRA